MADFVIKKISHRGVSHPVVARLAIQMKDIIEFAGFDKDVRDGVLNACFYDLQSRLGKCWDICGRIDVEQRRCMEEYEPSDDRGVQIPYIDDLDRDVDNFLYEAKNFLRDLVNLVVVTCHPDANIKDARAFFEPKDRDHGEFVKWAEVKFGTDDKFTKMLHADQNWIMELAFKRNAVEHPGGKSGTLTVHNVEVNQDGQLVAPSMGKDRGGARTHFYWDGNLLPFSPVACGRDHHFRMY